MQHDKHNVSLFAADNLCKLKYFKTIPLLFYTDVAKGVIQHSHNHQMCTSSDIKKEGGDTKSAVL